MGVANYDVQLHEAIKHIVDQDILVKGTAAYGIAQQVIQNGYERLTYAERVIYNAVVIPAVKRREQELEATRRASLSS